jgi:uncharacterized membrane protein YqgA involved in biofilm formation
LVGTIINVVAVVAGSLIGIFAGTRIPEKTKDTLVSVLGLFTLAYGVFIFSQTQNILIPLFSLIIGTILGELMKIEEGLNGLGVRLQEKVYGINPTMSGESQKFVTGFTSTSLLFIIGPMAILGSIQDGISGNFEMLAIKSLLDGIASIAFASTLGIGVAFSALTVLVYQGSISLLAGLIGKSFSEAIIAEMTATGGIILIGISISNLLQIKKIRTGSFLPALLIAVLIVLFLNFLGVSN